MTYFRFLIGFLAVLAALWVIIGEQLSGASADATINAQIVTIRAPVAGDLSVPRRPLGSTVQRGEMIAKLTDRLVDGVRLDDLTMETAFADAAVERAAQPVEKTKEIMNALEARRDLYRRERIAELETRLSHARERLAALEAGDVPEGAGADVALALDADAGRAPLEPRLPELWLSYARERVEVLEIALRAARSGVFLGDGYNDAPNAEQRLVELESELAGHEAALAEAVERKAVVAARLDAERRRVNRAGGGDIVSPAGGLYWEVLAADGANVQRGDPIARVLDCATLVVTASVSETVYNRLKIGDEVTFRPRGDSRVFRGSVSRLAGAGAATVYRELAVAPSQKHLERFDVMIDIPGLRADDELDCAVGRTGRVFFEARPLDWLRGFGN